MSGEQDWVEVMGSDELPAGQIMDFTLPSAESGGDSAENLGAENLGAENAIKDTDKGTELVVWRSEAGQVCAMEARCPHQWSHLGAEGMVEGEEIICCSHFWRFCLDGSGWKQNTDGRRDKKSDIAVFPTKEEDGVIYIQNLHIK